MATVTHTIYSHYDPQDREKLEPETGQLVEGGSIDSAEVWLQEAHGRKLAAPPQFVPATISYNDLGANQGESSSKLRTEESLGSNIADWYRSLAAAPSKFAPKDLGRRSPDATLSNANDTLEKPTRGIDKKNKNNWFIMKALQSEPSTLPATRPSTLADIIARDPPPLPSEGRYTPPVWIEISPSNKGFAMLQRGGWSEGEPLGPHVYRRKPVENIIPTFLDDRLSGNGKTRRLLQGTARREFIPVKVEDHDDISELRQVEVVDLTLSDSDSDSGLEEPSQNGLDSSNVKSGEAPIDSYSHFPPDVSAHGGKALLTPIATVLKSDRLGIGLKAKTSGPYKASVKRVTHNAAAMAAHIRGVEEIRRRKKEVGRGHRGFERQRRKEGTDRKAMLAYLNA